jgi:hypothetical protein
MNEYRIILANRGLSVYVKAATLEYGSESRAVILRDDKNAIVAVFPMEHIFGAAEKEKIHE